MNGVELIRHEPIHSDERGKTFSFRNGIYREILTLERKKGSVSGNHYHTGKDVTRNPEIQYLISGKIKLTVKDLQSGEIEEYIIEPHTEIRIAPMIAHKMEALEDSTFLEYHSEESDYSDMIKVDI